MRAGFREERPSKPAQEREGTTPNISDTEAQRAARSRFQSFVDAAGVPDTSALAQVMGFSRDQKKGKEWLSETGVLTELEDLDGDGVPEVVLSGIAPALSTQPDSRDGRSESAQSLYMLSWDGSHWEASLLLPHLGRLDVSTILLGPNAHALAVVDESPQNLIPYPLVFTIKDKKAFLVWDSRSDESRYTGYASGYVEFDQRKTGPEGRAEQSMVVTGRADPGLIVFPKTGRRGFQARTVYVWKGGEFVPVSTEYEKNEDYTLYRFISALHLHDFRTAYSFTVPHEFLKLEKPTLEIFRKRVEETWPEFLDDRIFEVDGTGQAAPPDFSFELALDNKRYVYRPAFSADGKFLLVGLERKQSK